MQIKNPEKILGEMIVTNEGKIWIICEVSKLADADTGPYVEFKLVTDEPVRSSSQQQFYHMTKQRIEKAELKIYKSDYAKVAIYELYCNGEGIKGYINDINTKDKFIQRLKGMLPNIN